MSQIENAAGRSKMDEFVKIEIQESEDDVEYIGDEEDEMESIHTGIPQSGAFSFPEQAPEREQSNQAYSPGDEEKGLSFTLTPNLVAFIQALLPKNQVNNNSDGAGSSGESPQSPGPSSETNSTSPLDLQRMSLSPAPRHNISDEEIDEMRQFLSDNPNVTSSDAALLFSTKFRKDITPELIDHLRNRRQQHQQQSSPQMLPWQLNQQSPETIQRSSPPNAYVEAQRISEMKALLEASNGLNHNFLAAQHQQLSDQFVGRTGTGRQNRPIEPLQKRKPFIRLSFGEKHIIAKFIKENPNKTYPEYAKYFTEAWNRTVTARQIITTKENLEKWLDEAYKDCTQTHYKFVDEGSAQDGPMVMKRKRSRVMLTPEEREEISNFLADHGTEMTFNQIAEHFAARWGKDVNRTHIASIMRLREKQSDQTLQFNKRARVAQHATHLSLPAPPALSQSLPINPRAMISPPARSMAPMSGLDLFNMLPQEINKHASPEKGSGTNCDRCPARFDTRQDLVAHYISSPDHLLPNASQMGPGHVLRSPESASKIVKNPLSAPIFPENRFGH
ncbi:Oidioi.mRNA.OKI2018_I69.chr1.g1780.t2.cds [Oikopleura dioica]|uniref:Oidioi.mRNA.OKI2018_I69.chr1.g1780.t2.cds n=1 Tax=Oikopleura dioica TaxID=34765 RepID=A0ABN7SU03_OIKDI|nr:Oidioi.mRNA.OKI2018_I69.chr1.g1780.t2.cds [Oikopleura dioica]